MLVYCPAHTKRCCLLDYYIVCAFLANLIKGILFNLNETGTAKTTKAFIYIWEGMFQDFIIFQIFHIDTNPRNHTLKFVR